MNKTLIHKTALSCLLAIASSTMVNAQSFDQAAASFSWAVGNESKATATENVIDALQNSKVTVGTDLTITSTESTYTLGDDKVGPYVTYQPGTSNAGCVSTDMIEYTLQMQKGITLQVSSISFDAVKVGTDNAFFSWSYTVDGVEGPVTAYSDPKTQIRRNNNANPEAPLTHVEEISAEAGRTFTLRFYLSDVANNKTISIGNIKIDGIVNGEKEVRAFTDFKIDFRTDPYTVQLPASGELPAGVSVDGTFHDSQHGYQKTLVTVPVDGPVRFTIAGCGYSKQATVTDSEGNVLATLNTNGAGCDTSTSTDHYVTWTYNSETPNTLVIDLGDYCPFLYAEACDLIPYCTIRYYDTDGKTIIAEEEVEGGSALAYTHGADEVTVAEGYKFRGWFNSAQSTAVKVAEGTPIEDNLSLYAKATEIEIPTNTSRYIYELNKVNFYMEDHEAIWTSENGYYHDAQHGWAFDGGGSLSIAVAGKALVTIGNCKYSAEANTVVTNAAGEEIATFPTQMEADGTETTIQFDSEKADTLTFNFGGTAYIHKVTVYNVVDFVEYNDQTGYYEIPANDANSFLLALASANATGNVKIFLPNGTYDLGELALTSISGENISIIGESMEGTIIRNAPLVENEGIGTTATLLNTSKGLYLQDLTLQNALEYYKSGAAGRAVCLQDKGSNTICKNVRMLSYQDTYYSNAASDRYWEDSEIHGTVDYLCGDGNVVYNRVALVNESRSANAKSGSDVISAPNCTASTDSRKNWGYVFLDCTIESFCNDFTFARSWGGESKAYYIRTKVLDNSLSASRWTAAGMNIAAYDFKEFGTMDAEGNVTTPESNIINFTHKDGDNSIETVMTEAEAAEFTLDNIFGEWHPEQYAAQVVIESLDNVSKLAPSFLVADTCDDETTLSIIADADIVPYIRAIQADEAAHALTLRAANLRGGFGPAFEVDMTQEGIEQIVSDVTAASSRTYNLFGQPVNSAKGITIVNGQKVIR